MSTSESDDFDTWIAAEFAERGPFTALVILVSIEGHKVAPLCSTYFSVIGTEIDWTELTLLLAGSGMDWHGVSFYAVTATTGGPLDNPTARLKLRALEDRLADDRLVLNEGHFFDKWGRRMLVEEVTPQ